MLKRCLWIAVVSAVFSSSAIPDEPKGDKVQPLLTWNGPNTTLKLQETRKSDTEREVDEHRVAARSLYGEKRYEQARREFQSCVELDAEDYEALLGVGYCSYNLREYETAITALEKARILKPEGYNANFWLGVSLMRLGRFKESIPPLEKAYQARKDDPDVRRELFLSYLIAGRSKEGLDLYPAVIAGAAAVSVFIYFLWFAVMLPFSLPVRTTNFPGLRFSIAWVALFFEGQFAFLFLLSALPWLHLGENELFGVVIAGLPVLAVAATGFARQPWGEPFKLPLRFGPPRIFWIGVLSIIGVQVVASIFGLLYARLTNNPVPMQNTIPLIKNALSADPAIAWVAIAFFMPMIEEVLFRGLIFGAFEKRWGIKGALIGSSFLFACIHFQLVGFVHLFAFGLILGWTRLRSGSLGLPILIHCLNNSVALLALSFDRST